MEFGREDVSLLERCPHFRGCYVQASMELRPEDVSLLGVRVLCMELRPEDASTIVKEVDLQQRFLVAPSPVSPSFREQYSTYDH